jgi:hypothetical protein
MNRSEVVQAIKMFSRIQDEKVRYFYQKLGEALVLSTNPTTMPVPERESDPVQQKSTG